MFEDRTLSCADCGSDFTFTVSEQEFYREKGFENDPKRCQDCRQARKTERYGNGSNSYGSNSHRNGSYGYQPRRQMFPAVCADCGKETEVPFEPSQGRPVYCSDCYRKVRTSR